MVFKKDIAFLIELYLHLFLLNNLLILCFLVERQIVVDCR